MADTKITALSENTAPISTDILPMVDDPSGTPVTKKVTIANLKTGLGLVKGDVGLGNVDNTSDANKPVSTAQQAALDAKAAALGADDNYVTDAEKVVIGNTSGTNTGDQTLPVKATGAEVNTGTDDAKFVTAKAITDSNVAFLSDIPASSEAFPIGSVFIAVVSTDPATLLGYGTWSAFGAGRVLVGLNAGDADFDTAEETGGAKTHTLAESEIPSHTHPQQTFGTTTGGSSGFTRDTSMSGSTVQVTLATGATGGGGAHNNLQPYIVVYMWKRTA